MTREWSVPYSALKQNEQWKETIEMLKVNDANNFRRKVAGLCLITAPLLLGMALLLHPGEGEAGLVQTIADNPGRTEAASLLIIASSVLFVPALMGILNLVRDRGVTLIHIGVGLALIGVIGHAVWSGFQVVLAGLTRSGLDQAQLAAAVEGGGPPPAGLIVVMLTFLVGFFLGMLVLAAGLWRSRTVPKWVPLGIVLLAVSDFVPVPGGSIVGAIASFLATMLLVACFGAIGVKLLTISDTDWEQGQVSPGERADIGDVQPRVQ